MSEATAHEPNSVSLLELTLDELDVDGALQETAAAAFPETRDDFLRNVFAGGAAVLAAAALPSTSAAANAHTKNDLNILKFDVVLEYLQSALYIEAERIGALKPRTRGLARVIGAHERAHLAALKALVGRESPKSPSFNFRGVTEDESRFVRTSVAFEDLTAALLKWQAVRLDSREIIAAAVTLHSVETRHAAWVRHVIGLPPVTSAFDEPASQRRMGRLVTSTRFIASRPKTARKRKPKFTG